MCNKGLFSNINKFFPIHHANSQSTLRDLAKDANMDKKVCWKQIKMTAPRISGM